jgi:hypothetical protein
VQWLRLAMNTVPLVLEGHGTRPDRHDRSRGTRLSRILQADNAVTENVSADLMFGLLQLARPVVERHPRSFAQRCYIHVSAFVAI